MKDLVTPFLFGKALSTKNRRIIWLLGIACCLTGHVKFGYWKKFLRACLTGF